MNYQFYNPHPKGLRVGDCVKRCFTKVLNKDYMEVQKLLNQIKNEIGSDKYNENRVWKELIKRNKFKKLSFPAVKGQDRMNGHTFTELYPKGTYILRMAGHLVACVDGIIYDTWDSRYKCVYTAFKV
jgi:hypothetical protein